MLQHVSPLAKPVYKPDKHVNRQTQFTISSLYIHVHVHMYNSTWIMALLTQILS